MQKYDSGILETLADAIGCKLVVKEPDGLKDIFDATAIIAEHGIYINIIDGENKHVCFKIDDIQCIMVLDDMITIDLKQDDELYHFHYNNNDDAIKAYNGILAELTITRE